MNKKSDRPILVYRFSSLGDIAMTVPVLRSFFNSYPNQKIVFVSRPYASVLFKELDNLEFIPIDLNKNYKGLGGLFSLFSKLYLYLTLCDYGCKVSCGFVFFFNNSFKNCPSSY